MVPGHALVGYWTYRAVESNHMDWSSRPLYEFREVLPFLDQGWLRLFETTKVTRGHEISLEAAVAEVRQKIQDSQADSMAERHRLIDITACRKAPELRILPNPAVSVSNDGSVEVHEYKPVEFNINMLQDRLAQEAQELRPAFTRWI